MWSGKERKLYDSTDRMCAFLGWPVFTKYRPLGGWRTVVCVRCTVYTHALKICTTMFGERSSSSKPSSYTLALSQHIEGMWPCSIHTTNNFYPSSDVRYKHCATRGLSHSHKSTARLPPNAWPNGWMEYTGITFLQLCLKRRAENSFG